MPYLFLIIFAVTVIIIFWLYIEEYIFYKTLDELEEKE